LAIAYLPKERMITTGVENGNDEKEEKGKEKGGRGREPGYPIYQIPIEERGCYFSYQPQIGWGRKRKKKRKGKEKKEEERNGVISRSNSRP